MAELSLLNVEYEHGSDSKFCILESIGHKKYNGLQSPAERLNGLSLIISYHANWLQDLLIAQGFGEDLETLLKNSYNQIVFIKKITCCLFCYFNAL